LHLTGGKRLPEGTTSVLNVKIKHVVKENEGTETHIEYQARRCRRELPISVAQGLRLNSKESDPKTSGSASYEDCTVPYKFFKIAHS
jgi:hypothetical protein